MKRVTVLLPSGELFDRVMADEDAARFMAAWSAECCSFPQRFVVGAGS